MKTLIVSIGILVIGLYDGVQAELSPEQVEFCIREAESKLTSLTVPPLLEKIYKETREFQKGPIVDTSHEFAAKVQLFMNSRQQQDFDQVCRGYWPHMIKLRDSTSCGNELEHYIGIYSLDRMNYLQNHQLFNEMIEMYELCFTIHCKQAYDRKQARLGQV